MHNLFNRFLIILFISLLIPSCVTSNKRNDTFIECKRYTPITEAQFLIIILNAMIEKAYAGYSLGYSELVILQTLKDDFQFWHSANLIGEAKNSMLDAGQSCAEALSYAFSIEIEEIAKKGFMEYALTAMKEGQKMMLKNPAPKSYAQKIIDEHPATAIRNADTTYKNKRKIVEEIEKRLQQKKNK